MTNQLLGKGTGDVLGDRYRIVSILGSGGMSTVYLAEDLRLAGKRWAVKETRPTKEEAHTCLAEADMLIRLNHPNLPKIVDFYPADSQGFSYLVMDYIEGETLLQRFERQARRMTEGQVIGYALQLCDLFHYLHTRRPDPIIYRDLKPANLMIDVEERVRLIDFGIARSFKAGQAGDTVSIGTIGFAAPEQFEGRQTDSRTDLYGLGALLYFLLSGGQYYCAAYKRLREHDAGLSASLTALVEKLLRAEPGERCQSAAEVRSELQRALAEQRAHDGTAAGAERQAPGSGATARGYARAEAAAAAGAAGMAQPPRIVAVGALYAGAGATFAALAIARALHELGVPHALLEPPGRQPELYALLYGERHAPAGYRCYNEAGREEPLSAASAWEHGCTLWLPAKALPYAQQRADSADPPNTEPGGRGTDLTGVGASLAHRAGRVADAPASPAYYLQTYGGPIMGDGLYAPSVGPGLHNHDNASSGSGLRGARDYWMAMFEDLERPIILIDIGSDWHEPAARELLGIATDLVYVADPLLHKLELASARRNLRLLGELRQSGKPVYGIANKAVASSHTAHWLRVLPEQPVCLMPAINQAKLAEASWLGVLVQERPGVKQPLNRALHPWLRSWLPQIGGQARPITKRMLNKFLNNG
ncbi:serine/threonine protein kinase [Paenibacillus foliorum]|uniref:serine/threonine protein kinase n=1 Tax=Paenibacillus foliorum TaxID=2654974 RepID=UPI001C12877F|nr:serine/threonine-protein kinase [Paenibacillus foliorum]